jgi:hypothetical protein
VYTPSDLARLKHFIEDSKKPSILIARSNKSFKHLLDVLRDMLTEGNQIAEFVYEVKKIISPLGIEVEKIHACNNSGVLYSGDYADLDKCPKCGYDQYKRKKDGGDDNNADDENEPDDSGGKKKKDNRGAPVRVALYFHHSSAEKMVRNTKGGPTLVLA